MMFGGGLYQSVRQHPKMWLAQNISPTYINNNTGTIPSGSPAWNNISLGTAGTDTDWYRVSIHMEAGENTGGFSGGSCTVTVGDSQTYSEWCEDAGGVWTPPPMVRCSEYRYFKLYNRAEAPAFPYIRLHWLNELGGIDSYSFTRSQGESLTKSFSTYEREPANPIRTNFGYGGFFPYSADTYPSNSYRLLSQNTSVVSEQYQTSQEVLSINARKKGFVFSDALNKTDSSWLEGLLTSPNVWMQVSNERGEMASTDDAVKHPSRQDYTPIIITNSEVATLDEEARTVQFKIEYQHGNSIVTQSN